MSHISQDSLATIYFEFIWHSSHATHIERYMANTVSFTGDTLPLGVKSHMRGLGPGDSVTLPMDSSEIPSHREGKILDLNRSRFQGELADGTPVKPRIGRYYPKHFIEDVPGTRPDSDSPFRVVAADKAGFKADLNHPMANREVRINARAVDIHTTKPKKAGTVRWADRFFRGPGMQARLPETPTDYLGANPFRRKESIADALFFEQADPSVKLDKQAGQNLKNVYADLLKDGMNMLDLMAGDTSHIPSEITLGSVTGLGVNASAMDANPALAQRVVHDLNQHPALPFQDAQFDAVICSCAIEYMTRPFEVFDEVARILKPGGVFALTFTDHWIPGKVIAIWEELLEFERMGLVSQYFVRTEKFTDLHTASERGWERVPDATDQPEPTESDPIFAVWGTRSE